MLKKVSLLTQLFFVLCLVLFIGHYLNKEIIRFFYTFSLAFKEILGFCLPFILFSFIASGILSLKKNAPTVLAVLISSIFISNMIIILLSFFVGINFLPFITGGISAQNIIISKSLTPFFTFSIPSVFSSAKAMIAAITSGIVLSFISVPKLEKWIFSMKNIVELILKKALIPFLPIYILGFLLKLNYEKTFTSLFSHYGKTFALIIIVQAAYLFLMYTVASGLSLKRAITSIKNALPSYLAAFSTMSSTAAIPVTIDSAEKNTQNRPLASIASPIMANIHLVGDGISTPILSLVTLSLFLGTIPNFFNYLIFAFNFCLIMLATSGIPGGGIIVMIPILKSILGFSPEMVSIITTLYLLQDSLGTAGNVMGDGALIMIINKILKRFNVIR